MTWVALSKMYLQICYKTCLLSPAEIDLFVHSAISNMSSPWPAMFSTSLHRFFSDLKNTSKMINYTIQCIIVIFLSFCFLNIFCFILWLLISYINSNNNNTVYIAAYIYINIFNTSLPLGKMFQYEQRIYILIFTYQYLYIFELHIQ